jgi:hypothetical protein
MAEREGDTDLARRLGASSKADKEKGRLSAVDIRPVMSERQDGY